MSSLTGQTGVRGNTGLQGNPTGTFKEKRPHGYQKFSMQNFTPQQMQLYQRWIDMFGPDSQLAQLAGGDQSQFEQLEAPALRQFAGLQGNLGSRFAGMGDLGSIESSGFQNTANAEASNFAQQLQANRLGLTRQAQQDLAQMYNLLLGQRPYEQGYVKKDRSGSGGVGSIVGAGVGGVGGFLAGGPTGALTGAGLGYNVGSSFDRGGGEQVPVGDISSLFKNFKSPFSQQQSSAHAYDQLFRHTGVAPY